MAEVQQQLVSCWPGAVAKVLLLQELLCNTWVLELGQYRDMHQPHHVTVGKGRWICYADLVVVGSCPSSDGHTL